MKFLFDLEGVVIEDEVLPIIARHFGCEESVADIVAQATAGNVPFIESFIRCANILGKYSVCEISDLLADIPLKSGVESFIRSHMEDCIVVTGNLTCWCGKLLHKLGCQHYGSEAECEGDKVVKLTSILRKEQIVDQYKALGENVVFIGAGNSDLEAMHHANISIASGLVHAPALSLLSICDYVVYSEAALCRQLYQLCGVYSSPKSMVINCAGIGSRLGLGLTKALLQINGASLISWQLKLFQDVEDVRIVIGFQGGEIIEEVLRYRKDVIFCYNHRYFETKTGASFYLGARHANPESIGWYGDLLVHPDDVRMLLSTPGEFICYGDIASEDAVLIRLDEDGQVLGFSRKEGEYEWTGPACLDKKHLSYCTQNVYNMLEPLCPMRGIKVRAYDIDTYGDYVRVSEITKSWYVLGR